MKKKLWWIFVGGFGFVALTVSLGAGFFALSPSQIEKIESVKVKITPVKIPDQPKAAEASPPTEPKAQNPLLAELAPDSFSTSLQDLGGGVGFGGGGAGPAIGGGGGFGTDASHLVKNQTAMDRPPRAVVKSPPDYPPEARTRNVSGFVIVKIFVGANGVIENVKVDKSEPSGFFDQAALRAVRSWKFEPAVTRGQAVAAWTTQKIKFELN